MTHGGLTVGKPAKSGLDRLSSLRADACGLYIGEADCFFRLRGWRTRGLHGRPLVNHRRPRPFPPWESTLNVRTSDSLVPLLNGILPVLFCDKRVYRKTARRINRKCSRMSGTMSKWLAHRQGCSLNVLVLSTPSRQGVLCKSSGLDRALACCTFAGTSLTRKSASSALSVLLTFSAN